MGTQHVQIDEAATMAGTTARELLMAAAEGTFQLWAHVASDGHAEEGYYDATEDDEPLWVPTCNLSRRFLHFAPLTSADASKLMRQSSVSMRFVDIPHEMPLIKGETVLWHFHPPVPITVAHLYVRRADIPRMREHFAGKAQPPPTAARNMRESSLLAVIAALLASWPKGSPPSAKDLEKAAQAVGVSVSDDTIRAAMAQAQEIATNLPPPK